MARSLPCRECKKYQSNQQVVINEKAFYREIVEKRANAVILVFSSINAASGIAVSGFNELKALYGDRIRFNFLDLDKNVEFRNNLNLGYSPTFLFYRKGELTGRLNGLRPFEALKEYLCNFIILEEDLNVNNNEG